MFVLWMLTIILRGTHIHCTVGVDKRLIKSQPREFPPRTSLFLQQYDECPDPEDFYNCTGYSTNHSRDGICFYFRNSDTLNCEGAKLTRLPRGIPTNVRTLLLSGNHIQSINQWMFSDFTSIFFLDLCYGWLHEVGTNTFTYMLSLEHLQIMQHYAMLQVGSLAFYELPNLKSLRIGPIQVITLDTVFFDLRNSRLEYLGLYDIKFDDIRRTTFDNLKLCPLTILEIYKSQINLLDALAFSGISKLHEMVLSETQIILVNRDAFMALSDLQSLNVTHCSIKDLPSGTFDPLKALKLLNLNGNMLQTIPVDLFKYNKNLVHIDLSNNHLLTLPEGLFNFPSNIHVDLSSNFFTCDCDLVWVSSWLGSLKNPSVNKNVLCHLPIKIRDLRLMDFKPVCIPPYTWYILSASLGLVAIVGVVSLLYMYRWKIYYQWYIMLSKRKNREVWMNHARFAFDAFVAYSERDFQWVLHELIPHLEDNAGPPYMKLCVSDRDWDLGSTILDNVESSIQRSRKTLCIISSHFLKSEWCKLEMSMAHMQLFSDNRDVLIFVFLEKIPSSRLSQHQRLRRELCKKSCLDWPGSNPKAQRLFWEKLRSLILKRHRETLPAV
ncbi:toll-like receptor 13 [Anguilla rostrata]|uniref:toll-like receptor 13 n=1 Tax=Anguilla rostrata TaxID=7938 RepID=UPI0030CEEAAF